VVNGDSEVESHQYMAELLLSNNLEQVIYTQHNSAFHLTGAGK